ncbi:MAG: DUF4136 domain-containing protein [Desulfobacteraceae bacterium]|nr:MAG: DUF4136 domain-containing protein [Desulfobacteraceae bacterium]
MGLKKNSFRFGTVAAIFFTILVTGGCGTAIRYSYDARTNFPELKTYQWAKSNIIYRQDSLLESNVRFLADQDLGNKGLTKKEDKADLLVWMSYEYDYSGYSYQLRMVTLTISRADNNEPVWRGTAVGDIRTDAASGDLKKAVEGILANFPPKG